MIRRFLAATLFLLGAFVFTLFLLPGTEEHSGVDTLPEVPLAQEAASDMSSAASPRSASRWQTQMAGLFTPRTAEAHHRESCSYSVSPGGTYGGCFGMAHVVVHLYDKDTGAPLGSQDEGCWGCGGAKSLTVDYPNYEACDLTVVPNASFNGRNLDVHAYLVPKPLATPTPEPTPTPPPPSCNPGDPNCLRCQEGRYIRETPPEASWEHKPNFPVARGQDPQRRGFDLRVLAQGGLVELVESGWKQQCADGPGFYPADCPGSEWAWVCHEETIDSEIDPLVRIDATMDLAPSSITWIEKLGSRYPGASRQEALPTLFTLWRGRLMTVRTGLFEYEATDPGVHEGKVKLYTAGNRLNNFTGQQVEVPYRVPVYLLDTTLAEGLLPPPDNTPPPAVTPAPGITPISGGGDVPPPGPGPIVTPRPEDR